MSRPSPKPTIKLFFLSFHHHHTSMTSPPLTHHPHLPARTKPPQLHPTFRNRSLHPTRHSSTSSAPPTAPSSHYDLFPATLPQGAPPHGPFTLDPRLLRKEFLQLQARFHPDRHRGESKARVEGTSALINEAYKTLQSPLLRAQHVLLLRGFDVAGDEGTNMDDEELLMEVLEVREAIEAAGQESEVEEMKKENKVRIRESEAVLEEAFGCDDLEMAKAEAVKLKYWMNIKESLDTWEKGKPVVLIH